MRVPKPPRHWLISPGPWRVLIVDDGALMRQYLARCVGTEPEFVVCGDLPAAVPAEKALARLKPNLVIAGLDIQGMERVGKAVSRWRGVPVLVLSTCDTCECAERALNAGARGFISMREMPERLPDALRRILHGQWYLSEPVAEEIALRRRFKEALPLLAEGEVDLLERLGRGLGVQEIAEQVRLSRETIESREASLMAKLKIESREALIRVAVLWVRGM